LFTHDKAEEGYNLRRRGAAHLRLYNGFEGGRGDKTRGKGKRDRKKGAGGRDR